MSIRIDREKCTGCGKCRSVCPGSLLTRDEANKTFNRFPRDCWGCTACVKECAFGAIQYFLGADVGGRGTTLHTSQDDQHIQWVFTRPSGEKKIITVDRQTANRY